MEKNVPVTYYRLFYYFSPQIKLIIHFKFIIIYLTFTSLQKMQCVEE